MTVARTSVIVIGAGIGGLSAAVDLSTKGLSTTVLEQSASVGGKAHQTMVAGQLIDTGPTVFTMRSVFDALFSRANHRLDDLLDITQLDVLARHFWRGNDSLDLFADIDRSIEAITTFSSPKEAENYRKFAQRSEALFIALDKSFMRANKPGPHSMAINAGVRNTITILRSGPFQTLWQSMCQSFDDPRLRQLFARYSTYCGSSPFQAPAILSLIAHAERAGVWMLNGGMKALASALQHVVEQTGGTVRCNCKVQEIDCKGDKIRGVILDSGEYINADAVVFNGDLGALHAGLLGVAAKRAVKKPPGKTLSAITMATVAQTSGKDLSAHNVFFGDDYAEEFDAIFTRHAICNDPTLYVCASDRHEQVTPGAPERLFCLMNAPAIDMPSEKLLEETNKIEHTLRDHGLNVHHMDAKPVFAHPALFNQRFPGSCGALYGQPTHGAFSSFARQGANTPIEGLYLAGGGVHPGAGVPMVSLSGQLAAARIDKDFTGTKR